jgi:hypothetical protein
LENKAIMEGSFFYRIGDEEDTLLVIARQHKIIPPAVKEVTGFTKNKFLIDWEITNEKDKQKRDT